MKVVVTAPAGRVGSRVVRLLIQAGVRPTLLARSPARLDPATSERADVVEADLGDAAAVVRATRNADALFWLEPFRAGQDGAAAGRDRRERAAPALRVLFHQLARAARLDPRRRVLRAPMHLDYPQPWVDPRDIGEIAAARLLSEGWSGSHVQAVHGPEDLTLAKVAAIIAEATDRTVRAETISQEALRSSLRSAGLGERQVEGMAGMSSVMREDFVADDKRTVITTTPTTLAAWAYVYLRPLLVCSAR